MLTNKKKNVLYRNVLECDTDALKGNRTFKQKGTNLTTYKACIWKRSGWGVKWQSQRHMPLLKNSLKVSIPCLRWLSWLLTTVVTSGLVSFDGLMINQCELHIYGQHLRALLCYCWRQWLRLCLIYSVCANRKLC